MVARRSVMLDLTGERSHEVAPWLSRLFWIGPSVPRDQPGCVVERDQRLNWAALDVLAPPLGHISYDGTDPGFVDYLRQRAYVREVEWTPAPLTDIDLRGTHIQRLVLHHRTGRLRARLADPTRFVSVRGSTVGLTLHAPHPPSLWLYQVQGPTAVDGLDEVTDLALVGCTDLRLAGLVAHTALTSLRISDCPILDIEELTRFRFLRELSIDNCYDFDATRFPGPDALPSVQSLRINGVRKDAAGAVQDRWRGHAGVSISGVRSQQWLLKNRDNPFREWADDGLPHARAASTAWGRTISSLAKIMPDDLPGATQVLHEFVVQFNKLDKRQGLDTTQVEDVAEAYDRLIATHAALREHPVIADRFEEWREF
jgi:hypothetical protein